MGLALQMEQMQRALDYMYFDIATVFSKLDSDFIWVIDVGLAHCESPATSALDPIQSLHMLVLSCPDSAEQLSGTVQGSKTT